MEQVMKSLYSEKFLSGVVNRGLHEVYLGQDILLEATEKMVNHINRVLDKSTPLAKRLSEFDEEGLRGACFSTIEFALSGMSITDKTMKDGKAKQRSVRYATANKVRREVFKGEDNKENMQIAMAMFELGVMSLDKWVDIDKDYDNPDGNSLKTIFTYNLKPEVQERMVEDILSKSGAGIYAMPTDVPPKDWRIVKNEKGHYRAVGGYHDDRQHFPLIRGGKMDMNRSSFNVDFLVDHPAPLKALNLIQKTAFRVNPQIFKVVKESLKDVPVRPEPSEAVKEEKRAMYAIFEEYPTRELREEAGVEIPEPSDEMKVFQSDLAKYKTDFGKYIGRKLAVGIAERYLDKTHIYFPHNFDYRGRMYPIPNSLTPQGDDVSKGLLEFAEPTILTQKGYEAQVAYLASVYGHDKEPYVKRLELGYELLYNPEVDYKDADEPLVFLQILLSLKSMEGKSTRISHTALAIDGSCNGLQHMAAITMDKEGGKFVNVGPNGPRGDIYMTIAETAADLLKFDIESFNAQDWISEENKKREKKAEEDEEYELADEEDAEEYLDRMKVCYKIIAGPKARKIAKRPVMINPYGGTYMGYKDYIYGSLKEFYPVEADNTNANIITSAVNKAMKLKLKGGAKYQSWISETFGIVAGLDIIPTYRTPDGFTVHNSSFVMDEESIALPSILTGKFRKFNSYKRTRELNVRKIRTRAQPNVIHSLDATHLRMTAIECRNQGIEQLWFIHDSYASNPNNYALLNKITREQFIKLYSEGEHHPANVIVESLRQNLPEDMREGVGFSPFPAFEGEQKLQLEEVINNEFFFA